MENKLYLYNKKQKGVNVSTVAFCEVDTLIELAITGKPSPNNNDIKITFTFILVYIFVSLYTSNRRTF